VKETCNLIDPNTWRNNDRMQEKERLRHQGSSGEERYKRDTQGGREGQRENAREKHRGREGVTERKRTRESGKESDGIMERKNDRSLLQQSTIKETIFCQRDL